MGVGNEEGRIILSEEGREADEFGFRKGNGNNGRKRKIFQEKSNPRVRERATFWLFRSSSNQCPSHPLYLIFMAPSPSLFFLSSFGQTRVFE